jgi:hypothetical protein
MKSCVVGVLRVAQGPFLYQNIDGRVVVVLGAYDALSLVGSIG